MGEDYNVDEADDGPRPFTALLDTGLKRTSTGSKVFAALKVRFIRHTRKAACSHKRDVCSMLLLLLLLHRNVESGSPGASSGRTIMHGRMLQGCVAMCQCPGRFQTR